MSRGHTSAAHFGADPETALWEQAEVLRDWTARNRLVTRHKRLPGASLRRVRAALVKRGLLAELTGVSPDAMVLQVKTALGLTEYAITRSGLVAIGVEEESPYGEDGSRDERAGVDPFLIDGPENAELEPRATAGPAVTQGVGVEAVEAPAANSPSRRGGGPSTSQTSAPTARSSTSGWAVSTPRGTC